MKFDAQKHHRRSIRLKDYDYTRSGAYFITTNIEECRNLLGIVEGGQVKLSTCGKIVQEVWQNLPRHYPYIVLDAFCIMPNHIHGIIVILDDPIDSRGGSCLGNQMNQLAGNISGNEILPAQKTRPYRHGLPEIVRALKSFSARRINRHLHTPGAVVWQRNYYEHIIRSETEWRRIRLYIENNPFNWMKDMEKEDFDR